jgi:hypothetical protein
MIKKIIISVITIVIILFTLGCNSEKSCKVNFEEDVIMYGDTLDINQTNTFVQNVMMSDSVWINFFGEYVNDTVEIYDKKKLICKVVLNSNASNFFAGTYGIRKSSDLKLVLGKTKCHVPYSSEYLLIDVSKSNNHFSFTMNNNIGRLFY